MKEISGSEKTFYYDYERYLQINKTQTNDQFYYIDLGCFDGRDIEQFIHFHSEEQILQTRNLTIIAFEPDPINYAACKSKQEQSTSIPKTIHNLAAWTKNDRVQYAIERGQKSRIDQNSTSYVHAIDFSQWLLKNFKPENYLYIKFTVDGAEIAILEKMIADRSLALVDYLEIEWTFPTSADFEPRRVSIEGMFDNFGIDYLYMIDPSDTERVNRTNESYTAVHKDHGWKLNTSSIRFHYQARKEVVTLLHERLKRRR
ncbi:hypothetical protein I4U23_028193 [Adineta vaga]|nr:hypothetical protein I4U23_028193 [Adineta vaga]